MAVDPSTLPGLRPPAPGVTGAQPSGVAGAIRKAAQTTGTSFEYLLATAKVESNLNPHLTAKSSSATGLFQFIDQTWLAMMKQTGRAQGYGRYADAIQRTSGGRYVVNDPSMRSEIMRLRKDPTANAVMAGEFTRQNAALLAKRIGRPPTEGELYIAHFFGAGGAAKLISSAGNSPRADATSLFPRAARANRPIFYDKQGNARSVAGVYAELVRRYQVARANPPASTMIADSGAKPAASPARSAPDTAGITRAFAVAQAPPAAAPKPSGPIFHNMFQTENRPGGVSPVVSELWSAQGAQTRAEEAQAAFGQPTPAAPAAPAGASGPLELFQETPPKARGLFGGKS